MCVYVLYSMLSEVPNWALGDWKYLYMFMVASGQIKKAGHELLCLALLLYAFEISIMYSKKTFGTSDLNYRLSTWSQFIAPFGNKFSVWSWVFEIPF